MKKINLDSYESFHNYLENKRNTCQGQIILKLTNQCNVNCKYCYNKDKINETLEMDINVAKQAILKIGPIFQELTINLTGGDINLYNKNKFKKLIDFIKKYIQTVKEFQKVKISIHPNAVGMDDDMKNYIKTFCNGVGFSYDGLCNEINRNCKSEIAINKMNELKKNGINYNILGVLTKETINNMDEELDHMMTFDSYFLHNPPMDYKLDDNLKLEKTDFATFYIKKLNYLLNSNKIILDQCGDVFKYFESFIGRNDCSTGLCRLLSNLYVIEPNGDIMGCPLRTENIFIYCNIYNIKNVFDIYKSNGYLNFEKLYYDKLIRCKNCKIFKYCHSGCIRGDISSNSLGKDTYCKDIQIIIKYIQLLIDNDIKLNNNIVEFNKIYKQILNEKGKK